ncbi:MAG TPA: hypothetical protein VGT78_14580 [Rhizomicrobium sp.]|nr:hypothetical protein [Rhizomicrobium sp.]
MLVSRPDFASFARPLPLSTRNPAERISAMLRSQSLWKETKQVERFAASSEWQPKGWNMMSGKAVSKCLLQRRVAQVSAQIACMNPRWRSIVEHRQNAGIAGLDD